VRTILDEHDGALKAFRDANDSFDHAMTGLRATLNALHEANHAQGQAIDRVIAANRAALALFNDEARG
jgi:hypothetical protein